MNRTLILVSALGAGLLTSAVVAQIPAAPASTPPASKPAAAPEAIPAKIALVAFEQAVFATNEGQRTVQDIQAKYKPKKDQIETLSQEVDSLKKQLQSAPAALSDADRATKLKEIDAKEKRLNHDAEDAQTAYNADLQEAYGKVAAKVSATLKDYVNKNGYTLLLDVSSQQSNIMWAGNGNTDVTEAVVAAYNTASGVAAPVPSAPSAPAPSRPRPSSTTPKAAAPKQ